MMARLLRSRGGRAQWALVGFVFAGLAAGLIVGLVAAPRGVALLPGLTSGIVATAGLAGPPRLVAQLAWWSAASTTLVVVLGFAGSGRPWLAAVAMAAVAVFTSAAAGIGPIGVAVGTLSTLAYVLALVISTETSARGSATVWDVALRAVAAAVAGFAVAWGGSTLRARGTPSPQMTIPAPWRPIWHSVRTLDEHARDGVRRAVPLVLCVLWYEATGGHDQLWVLISALAVLLPTGKSTAESALARVVATVVGVVVVVLVGRLLPAGVLVGTAIVAMLVGIAYKPVVPLVAGAASAFAAVVFVGTPSDELASTAGHRLLDTLAGVAIALAATYLLWPRDAPEDDAGEGASPEVAT